MDNERVIRPSYATLIVALSEINEELCPKYTILNLTVDECFSNCPDGAMWTDQADMESIIEVQKELGLWT